MSKTLRRTYAGPLEIDVCYPRVKAADAPRVRAAKKKATSEAMRRSNNIRRHTKLELQLAANFPTAGSALVCTLTYDDEHAPKARRPSQARRAVQADFRKFLDRMRRARKRMRLADVVAFWAIEVLTAANGRWHVHLVINNTGQDYDAIRKAWSFGREIEIEPLEISPEKDWAALASYLTKESREVQDAESRPGLNAWSHTRNIRQPETETVIVPDDYQIEVPDNATVLLDERRSTEYASFQVVKLRYDMPPARPAAKRKRRRR